MSDVSTPASSAPVPRQPGAGDHVFLVDGSSFVFRAYFQSMNQDRKYNYRSDGLPTGAVRLFCTKVFQFLREGAVGIRPTHLAIIFDKSEQSFRKELYPAYKANRPPPPEDLVPQFPLMREAVRAFGLTPVEQERYEADDLIATYARQATETGAEVLIVSADKDLMQLIRPGVVMYDPASGTQSKGSFRAERLIGEDEVVAYFGVPPRQVVDVQSLAGDSTDNVPGVPGIGIKTAAQLITEYGDLDSLLASAAEIRQPKRRETLITNADNARVSRELVRLVDDVDVVVPLANFAVHQPDAEHLVSFLKSMEFTTITRRAAEVYGVDAEAVAPAATPVAATDALSSDNSSANESSVSSSNEASEAVPEAVAARAAKAQRAVPFDTSTYETVSTYEALDAWIKRATELGVVAVDTETDSLDAMAANLVGISLATAPGVACYIPLRHGTADKQGGLFADDEAPAADAGVAQLSPDDVLARLKPLLTDAGVLKVGQNFKYDWLLFARHGIDVFPYDDTMLLSYALDAGLGGHGMDALSEKHLGHKPISFTDVAGKGRNAVTFDKVAIDKATAYAAEDADVTLRLWHVLKPRIVGEGMATVYETLERPMAAVLARMEQRGIAIDSALLSRLSGEFAQRLGGLEAEIHDLAGESFNVGSPKQLGEILFGRMGLPGAKKTATGQWATGAGVLEDLAEQGHELPARILDWRQLSKLRSTYTDALPGFINPETRRVHTSFALASTTTGRLASSDPNLQNIPIRTEEGRKIRQAFVAEPGWKLVSADYSQIELRLLAHVADIPQLRRAFEDGIDIHAMTASEMFGVPVEGMDPMIRRRAKAINFGIIYGISAFGLANQLGIGREEAGIYIRRYFERFPGIRDYMDETKQFVREHGYVKTVFGRVCHYPQIHSKNASERAFVERQSINAPLQGAAADIIRRAMVRMEPALEKAGLSARMLLQVHDELVFEVRDDEIEATLPLIRNVMEQSPLPAVELKVPLAVEARAASDWDGAH
ncbi:DNA polymerase I [Pseudochelatococcus contaminans]|uniref:DNA polymerase I n=1 Tax=Pseudochelatococcus contaminans TaxID=1538103 RepID=A0A7W5Z153_9HYPH|nr:DNA polymerase I [Pseudochelatococcus contaminans]MBB3807947.1 DNA polymerase-1 [Pseudochelatococcus contaminans]